MGEVSEAELQEWEEEQRAEADEVGAGEELLFLPTPPLPWQPQRRSRGRVTTLLCFSFVPLFSAHLFFLKTSLSGGQRGACNVPPPRG